MNADINLRVFPKVVSKVQVILVSLHFSLFALLFSVKERLKERLITDSSSGVLRMQERLVGKNVDLKLLSELVENFFKDRSFKITKDRSASDYTISARPQKGVGILGRVIVKIRGDSNDFAIEFSTSGHSRSALKLGFMTTMFGGGSLVLRGLKSQEAVERLEKEFWIFIEEALAHLIDSTNQDLKRIF